MKRKTLWPLAALAFALTTLLAGCFDIVVGDSTPCKYDGRAYKRGAQFPASDGCNTCSCGEDGLVACSEIGCVPAPYEPCEGKLCGDHCTLCAPDDRDCNEDEGERRCSASGECMVGGEASCTACEYGGKTYAPGDSFPDEDGCNACSCSEDGLVVCTTKACVYDSCEGRKCGDVCSVCGPGATDCDAPLGVCSAGGECLSAGAVSCTGCTYNGTTYAPGASFPDEDGCNTCSCSEEGLVACTEIACVPPPGNCRVGNLTLNNGDSVFCPDGCNSCSCQDGLLTETLKGCPPLPEIEVCDGPTTDDASQVSPLYLAGDALALELGYGGCDAHPLKLCTNGAFLESEPVQLKLFVVDPTPQECDAALTSQQVFDISAIRDWYDQGYPGGSRKVQLNLKGGSVLYAF